MHAPHQRPLAVTGRRQQFKVPERARAIEPSGHRPGDSGGDVFSLGSEADVLLDGDRLRIGPRRRRTVGQSFATARNARQPRLDMGAHLFDGRAPAAVFEHDDLACVPGDRRRLEFENGRVLVGELLHGSDRFDLLGQPLRNLAQIAGDPVVHRGRVGASADGVESLGDLIQPL